MHKRGATLRIRFPVDAKINGNVCLSSVIRGLRPVAMSYRDAVSVGPRSDEFALYSHLTDETGFIHRSLGDFVVGISVPGEQPAPDSVHIFFNDMLAFSKKLVDRRASFAPGEIFPTWMPYHYISVQPKGVYRVDYGMFPGGMVWRMFQESRSFPDQGWYSRLYYHSSFPTTRDSAASVIQQGWRRLVRRKAASNIQRVYRGLRGRRKAIALRYAPGGPGARRAKERFVRALAREKTL